LIDRIIDHERFPYHIAGANKAPTPAVKRVLTVVAEDKILSFRDNDFSIHNLLRKHLMTFFATGKARIIREVIWIEVRFTSFVYYILFIESYSIQNQNFPRDTDVIARGAMTRFMRTTLGSCGNKKSAILPRSAG
jgi:hypothetical protein